MNKLNSKRAAAIAGVALSFSIFSANSAKAVTVTFSQEGWEYGGELSGSFTGDDFNGDDIIEASELSDFSATFSGNLSSATNSPITGEPFVLFFRFSHLLPSLEPPNPNVKASFDFRYSSSTSQLSFSSFRETCNLRPIGGCRIQNNNRMSVSGAGGFIGYNIFAGFGEFTSRSSSALNIGCSASNLQ